MDTCEQIKIFNRVYEKQLFKGPSALPKHRACKYCGADGENVKLSPCGNREYICSKCKKTHEKSVNNAGKKASYSKAKKFGEGWTDNCGRHHDEPYQDQFDLWHTGNEKGDVWDDEEVCECFRCGAREDEPNEGFVPGPDGEMYCCSCYDELFI